MTWFIFAAVAAMILLPLLLKTWSRHGARIVRNPYHKRAHLFSADDRAFHPVLKEAMGNDYEIFGKIPVADIVLAKKIAGRGHGRSSFNPLAGRYFDFVLCDKKSLAVLCAIVLYDKTNPARQAEQGDPLKRICEAVSLPLVVIHVKADYAADEVREKLRQAMTQEPFYLIESSGRKEPRISSLDNMDI